MTRSAVRSPWTWLGALLLAACLALLLQGQGWADRRRLSDAELDAAAARAATAVSAILRGQLALVEAAGRDWEQAGLDPAGPEATRWLAAIRNRIPGTLWAAVTDGAGTVIATPAAERTHAQVGDRAWFRLGLHAPAILPARDSALLRPHLLAAGLEPERLLDLVTPVHDAAGETVGVLEVAVPESAMAAALRQAAPAAGRALRLLIGDAAGATMLGVDGLAPGLDRTSRGVPLAVDAATAALDWTVRVEATAADGRGIDLPRGLQALATVLFASVLLALLRQAWRDTPASAPTDRLRALVQRLPQAMPVVLALCAALALLLGIELLAAARRQALDAEAEAAAHTALSITLDWQTSRRSNVLTMQTLAGRVTARLAAGEAAGFDEARGALRARLARPDLLGMEVQGLDAAGAPLWTTAKEFAPGAAVDAADLAPILAGAADVAYGLVRRDGAGRLVLPIAGAVRDATGRLRSIAVVQARALQVAAGLALLTGWDGPVGLLSAADGTLLALARVDGPLLLRSDLRSLPGDRLPATLVTALKAAAGSVVVARAGAFGMPADRLVAARQQMPDGLVAVASFDLGGLRAALAERLGLLRAAGLAFGALLLVLAMQWRRAAALRGARRAAEATAAAAERDAGFFRALTDSLQESLAVLDGEGRIRFHNAQAVRLFGAERMAGAIGRNLAELFVEEEFRPGAASRIRLAVAGETLPSARYTIAGPDGRPLTFEGRVWGLSAAAQGVLGGRAMGGCLDITDRVAAEAAHAAAEARIQELLATMPGLLLEFDLSDPADPMRVTWCSASVGRLLGATPEEAMAPGWWRRITPGEPRGELTEALPRLRAGGELPAEIRIRRADGEERIFAALARMPRNELGMHVIAYLKDVTEERRATARLQDLARSGLLADVAIGFSHEVNQPLSIISMGLQNIQRMLGRLLPAEASLQARMQRVIDQAQRIGRMTEDFRSLGAGAAAERGSVDVAAEARAAAERVATEAASVGVTIILDLPAHLPAALGQPLALRQALVELLRAAVVAYQAMPDDQSTDVVTLAARVEAGAVVLAVVDAAGPIPETLLAQVFQPFAPIRTAAPSGGLGLAKCWQAVLAMQGEVAAANDGAGVRMELRLAVAVPATAVAVAANA